MNNNAIDISAIKDVTSSERNMPGAYAQKTESTETKTSQQVRKEKQKEETSLSVKDADELTEDMNELMDDLQTNLGFSIREELNHQVVVEIKNRETDELVKQIPAEELLKIKEKMEELTGLIFDESV